MNRYTLVDIVREKNPLFSSNPSLQEDLFVAVIKDTQQEQPFRLVVENFASAEEARKEIAAWIAAREEEDARRVDEVTKAEAEVAKEARLGDLKSALLS